MTKRHFIALAQALANVRPLASEHVPEMTTWTDCIEAVAHTCGQFNPAFDHNKFTTACCTLAPKATR